MTSQEVIDILQTQAPESFAADWDQENVGLQVGRRDKTVKTIYIALDATKEVIEDAISQKADMLLTHHPMIFGGVRKVNTDTSVGRRILRLAACDIPYYAMHTNFDVKGMAELSAEYMQLENPEILEITTDNQEGKEGFGRTGTLSRPMTLKECAKEVKKAFGLEQVKVFGDLNGTISSAAISPGSGKSMIPAALEADVDVFITGDIDHHSGIDAVAEGLSIIDAGHYGLEHIFVDYMAVFLEREAGELHIIKEAEKHPFVIL